MGRNLADVFLLDVGPWFSEPVSQATCWDGDAGADRKTSASMQPSAPLARVWVGGGVFKVGSLMASTTRHDRHDYCGCHVLEQGKGTIVLILPGLPGCCCRVGGGERGPQIVQRRDELRGDAPDELLVRV